MNEPDKPPGDVTTRVQEADVTPVRPPAGRRSLSFAVPEQLGPYRLVRELGRGGMGLVFEAMDETLRRRVAVKVLGPWLIGQPTAAARFEAEARILANLQHPAIVQVLGAGREGELFYFAMEFVLGHALSQSLAEGPLPAARVMELGVQMADGLAAAHAAGVIHRDFKPQNVLMRSDGAIKVADFGLSRSVDEARLTGPGEIFGTPVYMAPEQVQGHPPGPATDVYALGVVLFELLTGRPPFEGGSPFSTAMKHVHELPPDVRAVSAQTPPRLGALVMRCLSKEPGQRPVAADVKLALEALLADHRALETTLRPLAALAPTAAQGPATGEFGSAWGAVAHVDVSGFHALQEAASPALTGRFLGELYRAMRTSVDSAGGHVVQFIGDACLAVFCADDPRVAVSRALDATERLHRAVVDVGVRFAQEVTLRIGLSAGELLVGPVHDGQSYRLVVLGETVNGAARIERLLARPGTTYVADAVVPYLPDGWVTRSRERAGPLTALEVARSPVPAPDPG